MSTIYTHRRTDGLGGRTDGRAHVGEAWDGGSLITVIIQHIIFLKVAHIFVILTDTIKRTTNNNVLSNYSHI